MKTKNCLYCGQTKKAKIQDFFHKRCKAFYYAKIEKALKKTIFYPEINIRRKGILTKIKVCRRCKFEISERMIRLTKHYVEKEELKGVNGLCLNCVKSIWGD